MLAYILALAVGLGSIAIYTAAFFFPEVHRKNDFILSGVGFFYALVLWVCAGRITGGLLLGQIASVTLLGLFAWETLKSRRELAPVTQQTPIPSKEKLQEKLSSLTPPGGLPKLQERATNLFTNATEQIQKTVGAVMKRKDELLAKKPQQPTIAKEPEKPTVTQPEATIVTSEEPTLIEVVPLGSEFTAPTYQPGGPDMPGASGKKSISIEEIAPEVELAPPAEPVGSGDPSERLSSDAIASVPTEVPQTFSVIPSEIESPPETEPPELVRPNPPDPELVEAAIEDAEEKSLPASPPEPDIEHSLKSEHTP